MLQRLFFALFALLLLAGCAHSPQQLEPQPKLKKQLTAVGQGQRVVVRVSDGRPSPALGTRGGLYPETSTISVPKDSILPRLQAEAEVAMRLLGFLPVQQADDAAQFSMTLAELKYVTPKDRSYVTEATITASLLVDVANNGRRYNGRYDASLNQRFGMAPSQQTNTELISDVLSDALTRVFDDGNIARLLAQ